MTRRVPGGADEVWAVLFAPDTMATWVPGAGGSETEGTVAGAGAPGTAVRVLEPRRHLRYTTHPAEWPRPSTLDVEVTPEGEASTVSFRQGAIPGPEAREERREAYRAVLDAVHARFATP